MNARTQDFLLNNGINPDSVGSQPSVQEQLGSINQQLDRLRLPQNFDPFSPQGREYLMQRKNLMTERADLYDTLQTRMAASGQNSLADKKELALFDAALKGRLNGQSDAAAMERIQMGIDADNKRAKDNRNAEITQKEKDRHADAQKLYAQKSADFLKLLADSTTDRDELAARFAEMTSLFKIFGGAGGGAGSSMPDANDHVTK